MKFESNFKFCGGYIIRIRIYNLFINICMKTFEKKFKENYYALFPIPTL